MGAGAVHLHEPGDRRQRHRHTEVDDHGDEANFVSSDTIGQRNTFDTAIVLPAGGIPFVLGISALARQSGTSTVTAIALGFDDQITGEIMGEESSLSGAHERHDLLITNNPNTGVKFTSGELVGLTVLLESA